MKLFRNKYRNGTFRAQWWDYGQNAAYFITLVIQDRIHFFGEIENGKMQLSPLGAAAESCWHEIPSHFPFVKLGAFVVMPDHLHGIIIIDKPDGAAPIQPANQPTNQPAIRRRNQFGPQSQNLASIVRGFKIGVTKISKTICPQFRWQRLYYDHIIRNEIEYYRMSRYIERNPENWGKKRGSSRVP